MLSRLSITRGSCLSVSQCSATPTWISRSKMLKIFTIHTNTQSHTHFCSKHLHPSWRRRKEWAFGGRGGGGSTSNDVPSFVFPSWGFVTFERSPRLDFLFKEHWNCVCDEMGTYLRNGMHSKCLANICICSRCTQEGLCLMWVWCVCLKWLLVEHTHTHGLRKAFTGTYRWAWVNSLLNTRLCFVSSWCHIICFWLGSNVCWMQSDAGICGCCLWRWLLSVKGRRFWVVQRQILRIGSLI